MVLRKDALISIAVAAAYLWIVHQAMGLRWDHFLFVGFLLSCYFLHPKSRRFVVDFMPMILFGILYDFLRVYPKDWAGTIQVAWPHQVEESLFGFLYQGKEAIPCDYFLENTHPALDVLAGVIYSLHIIIPVGFAFIAWLKDPILIRRFNWAFFTVNLFAFATYIGFPVAPPWYVQKYGFAPGDWNVPSDPAGLARFDALVGVPYFAGVYAKNAWVFGAIPSMHAGSPFLVFCYAARIMRKALIPIALFMVLMWTRKWYGWL